MIVTLKHGPIHMTWVGFARWPPGLAAILYRFPATRIEHLEIRPAA